MHAAAVGASGQAEGIVSTGIDITLQRAAEEKLAILEAAGTNANPLFDNVLDVGLAEGAANSVADERSPVAAGETSAAPFRPLPEGAHGERRKRPRRAFDYQQRIAAVVSGQLPDPRRFMEVNCHDISSGGFSFISPSPPGYATYVVALGAAPAVIYVLAKVAHIRAIHSDGQTNYVVGCQYVGRAEYGK